MLEYAELLVNKHLDDYGMLYQIQGLVELQEDLVLCRYPAAGTYILIGFY